ncbi:MAG: DUF1622 domain-containing protein [Acidimicrobiales bacterium]
MPVLALNVSQAAEAERVSRIEGLFENIGVAFDVAGVFAIVIGVAIATVRFVHHYAALAHDGFPFRRYKIDLGLSLLLGLEILVAADIIKTVAVSPSFDSLGVLALLVVIRTFLGWALVLEIEGRWPWSKTDGAPVAAEEI